MRSNHCRPQVAVACFVIFVAPLAVTAQTPQQSPNVMLLVLDTVRWSDLSFADPALNTSPELVELAKDGVVFSEAYATVDWTLPSHFSIFTGLYHRVLPYDTPRNSIAHHLRGAGYATYGVSANGLITSQESYVRPIEHYEVPHWEIKEKLPSNAEYQERAAELLDYYDAPRTEFSSILALCNAPDVGVAASRMLAGKPADRPFFLFMNFMDAHDPYFPLPEYYDIEEDPFVIDFFSDMRTRYIKPWDHYLKSEARLEEVQEKFERNCKGLRWMISVDLEPQALDIYHKRYRASIRQVDAEVGRLVRELKESGLYDQTVIVVVSDHGESFGEKDYMVHGLGNNGDRDATLHVPLLVVAPQTHGKGRVVEEEVSIADVAPTIHGLTGINFNREPIRGYPNSDYGRSLLPLMGVEPVPVTHEFDASLLREDAKTPDADQELTDRLEALGYLE